MNAATQAGSRVRGAEAAPVHAHDSGPLTAQTQRLSYQDGSTRPRNTFTCEIDGLSNGSKHLDTFCFVC